MSDQMNTGFSMQPKKQNGQKFLVIFHIKNKERNL